MSKKEPHVTEKEVFDKLEEYLSKCGFNIHFNDTYRNVQGPDFVAQKRIKGAEYRIAIELKSSRNISEAVRNGIKTLSKANESTKFDKLLLLLRNTNNAHKKNIALQNFQSENPTNLEIINLEDLGRWSQDLSNELSPKETNEVFLYIRQLSKKLIELVAKDPENLMHLEWRDLERTISELFEGIGFKTTLTPGSKDGGKDVILECIVDDIQKSFIIEIKHWRSGQKVGQAAVKEFTNIVISEKRDMGVYLSTYGFTSNHYETLSEKQKSVVRFGEKEKIIELCKTYEKVSNGIWNPVETLENVLFDNTINPQI